MGRMWDLIVSAPDHCLTFYFFVHSYKIPLIYSDICTLNLATVDIRKHPVVACVEVVGDVTARHSKMHGELVSLKRRPMTSRAVCYRIELFVAKTFMPG